jgi:hypothetical protein
MVILLAVCQLNFWSLLIQPAEKLNPAITRIKPRISNSESDGFRIEPVVPDELSSNDRRHFGNINI